MRLHCSGFWCYSQQSPCSSGSYNLASPQSAILSVPLVRERFLDVTTGTGLHSTACWLVVVFCSHLCPKEKFSGWVLNSTLQLLCPVFHPHHPQRNFWGLDWTLTRGAIWERVGVQKRMTKNSPCTLWRFTLSTWHSPELECNYNWFGIRCQTKPFSSKLFLVMVFCHSSRNETRQNWSQRSGLVLWQPECAALRKKILELSAGNMSSRLASLELIKIHRFLAL